MRHAQYLFNWLLNNGFEKEAIVVLSIVIKFHNADGLNLHKKYISDSYIRHFASYYVETLRGRMIRKNKERDFIKFCRIIGLDKHNEFK